VKNILTKVATAAATTVGLSVAIAVVEVPAQAAKFQWSVEDGGNGHFYEPVVVPNGIGWLDANAAATAAGGYLVTLTSAAENAFVHSLIANNPDIWVSQQVVGVSTYGPWIGLFQPPGAPEPAGGWSWVTGEAFNYANWVPGRPNDLQGIEDYGHFLGLGLGNFADTWNDQPNNSTELNPAAPNIRGYIVEYKSIPEPASVLGLLAFGALGATVTRKKKLAAQKAEA
jgi:Lectin C-type domain/PEP-CTERM motif